MWRRIVGHCSDDTLVALLDDELTLPSRGIAERHIGACDRCAGLLSRHRHAQAVLAGTFDALEFDALEFDLRPAPVLHRRAYLAVGASGLVLGSAGALALAGLLIRRHHVRPTAGLIQAK